MKTREKAKNAGVLAGGIFVVLSAISPVMAHPGGAAPPVHPPIHPAGIHGHPGGGANMGLAHMSPTPANFGQTVSGVASTQGQTISQDARSGMTGQALSAVAKQHGQRVSDVATGTTPSAPPPPPPGGAPAPAPIPAP
jgi:hypothetical protein